MTDRKRGDRGDGGAGGPERRGGEEQPAGKKRDAGPVPVRDLLRQMRPEREAGGGPAGAEWTGSPPAGGPVAGGAGPGRGSAPAPAGEPTSEGGPPGTAPPAADRGATGRELRFEHDGEEWLARVAGEAVYGTGRLGVARLVAIHFHAAADPKQPVREALMPAARFARLAPEELGAVFDRAKPIDTVDES